MSEEQQEQQEQQAAPSPQEHPLHGLTVDEATPLIKEKGIEIIKVYRVGDVVFDVWFDKGVALYLDKDDKIAKVVFAKVR